MIRRHLLLLASAAVPSASAYFGLTPRAAVPTRLEAIAEPPQLPRLEATPEPRSFPTLNIHKTFGTENEYQLNLGKAIDTLRRDYPHMLHTAPDFTIFTDDIQLSGAGSSTPSLAGKERYMHLFGALRFLRNTTMVHDEVGARLVVSDGTIRVRWHAKLTMTSAFAALPGLARDKSCRPVVWVDGVSMYEVNGDGLVHRHVLEDVVVTPPELQGAVDLALFSWPGGLSPPMPAVAAPYSSNDRDLHHLAVSLPGTGGVHPAPSDGRASINTHAVHFGEVGSTGRRRVAESRAPAPVAMARETPMERAARERAEDAEQAKRLSELRAPPIVRSQDGPKGGLLSRLLPSDLVPQTCESNFDCDNPLVCCNLGFASICCSSGMMIGPPPDASAVPQLQRQAIPIPIPVDDDTSSRDRPGGGFDGVGGSAGNGYPTPP